MKILVSIGRCWGIAGHLPGQYSNSNNNKNNQYQGDSRKKGSCYPIQSSKPDDMIILEYEVFRK